MIVKRITKKLTKIAAWVLGIIVVLFAAFHFWFIHHAEGLIEDLVHSQSNGKLNLDIKKFHFNWFSRKMELREAVFFSTDTLTATTAYRFKVDRVKIQVKKILPLIFDKSFYIDSIHLVNPDINVTKLRGRDTSQVTSDTSLSIPQEMGRIYHSIQDALQVLRVDRFQIDNGSFTLANKTRPEEKPITISRLYFHLDNLQVDTTNVESGKKILFSDDVGLHTVHQDILFPDGRHRLSFSNFRINIRNRLAEFDSCTIIATKGDSANNSFRIFFDKLLMTNIDFDTLYHTEVIKADSVYCINPRFRLDVDLPKRTGPISPPKLDELIQQLTGNLEVNYVVVQNGSFDINTMREGRPSSFTSDNNNFELQGLRIREDAPKPLTVERFAMAIRNYENFLRDSTYAIQFDSVLLNNNRISLSNFSYKERKNNKILNSLSMPQFELQGLSWDDLIFEQQLNADRASLYKPVIIYNARNKNRSQDVFGVLSDVGNILQLKNLDISNGQLKLFLNNNSVLQLDGATIAVSGQQLVDSRRVTSIQRSVKRLDFKKGQFTAPGWTATMENVQFDGTVNQLNAGSIQVKNKEALSVDAKGVVIRSMNLDEKLQKGTIKGISWQQAHVNMASFANSGGIGQGGLVLEDIRGTNTKVSASKNGRKISVFLQTLSASKLEKLKGEPIQLLGFAARGNDLLVTDSSLHLSVKKLAVKDQGSSSLENIVYTRQSGTDSVHVDIPSLTAEPDIQALLKGHISADNIMVSQPYVRMHISAKAPAEKRNTGQHIFLGSLLIQQPVIHYASTSEKGTTSFEWKGRDNNNSFRLTDLKMEQGRNTSVSAGQLQFTMDHFLYMGPNGKTFAAGEGKLTGQVNQLAWQKNDADAWDWQGIIARLTAENFVIDSLGKKGGTLNIVSAKLNDLSVSSSLLLNFRELITQNTRFNLQDVTGDYQNSDNQFYWHNAAYDKKSRFFSVDSFSYRPTLEKNEFIKGLKYQADYLTIQAGAVTMGPFDIQRYMKDTVLDLGVVTINNGVLRSYRDMRLPRQPGAVKPLPVTMLKNINKRLLVDTMIMKDAMVEYSEMNPKTQTEGTITVTRLNGNVTHMRNFDMTEADSLDIHVSGYLQDTLLTKLHVRESYTDSLNGFLMTGQMGPADMRILNPVLIPLASAELRSGKLDTLSMVVTGKEFVAIGKIEMYYHDLKVKINKPGKKPLFRGLTTFFANTLIKNKNTDRPGNIFFQRLRDRSAINYLVKITLSGMTSSIGVKSHKKKIRAYQRKQGKNN